MLNQNIVKFPVRQTKTASREETLKTLVPDLLGVLYEHGTIIAGHFPRVEVALPSAMPTLEIAAFRSELQIHLSVYWTGDSHVKVLSANLSQVPLIDPRRRPALYFEGKLMLLSWKRGEWETKVAALAPSRPRSIEQIFYGGLTRQGSPPAVPDRTPPAGN